MTVNELIELLESMPTDAEVYIGDINTNDFMTSDEVNFRYLRRFEDDQYPVGLYIFMNTDDEIEAGIEEMGAVE